MASQITSLTIVYSTVYSGADKKKPAKLRVAGLCAGNSSAAGEFPAQRASNAENVSIWWRHHVLTDPLCSPSKLTCVRTLIDKLKWHQWSLDSNNETNFVFCYFTVILKPLKYTDWSTPLIFQFKSFICTQRPVDHTLGLYTTLCSRFVVDKIIIISLIHMGTQNDRAVWFV